MSNGNSTRPSPSVLVYASDSDVSDVLIERLQEEGYSPKECPKLSDVIVDIARMEPRPVALVGNAFGNAFGGGDDLLAALETYQQRGGRPIPMVLWISGGIFALPQYWVFLAPLRVKVLDTPFEVEDVMAYLYLFTHRAEPPPFRWWRRLHRVHPRRKLFEPLRFLEHPPLR